MKLHAIQSVRNYPGATWQFSVAIQYINASGKAGVFLAGNSHGLPVLLTILEANLIFVYGPNCVFALHFGIINLRFSLFQELSRTLQSVRGNFDRS